MEHVKMEFKTVRHPSRVQFDSERTMLSSLGWVQDVVAIEAYCEASFHRPADYVEKRIAELQGLISNDRRDLSHLEMANSRGAELGDGSQYKNPIMKYEAEIELLEKNPNSDSK